MSKIIVLLFAILLVTNLSFAKGKNTYMVTVPHTKEECMNVLNDFKDKGAILNKFVWGCMDGDHTAYATIEAKDVKEVKNMLPEDIQSKAKIVKVNKFTPKQIEDLHKKM